MPINRIESGVPPAKTRLVLIGTGYTDVVSSGSGVTKQYTPPVNKIWDVNSMYLHALPPVGAASGSHEITIKGGSLFVMYGKSSFNTNLSWHYNMWESADLSQKPSTEVGALIALHNIVLDHDNDLEVTYDNNTDVSQTNQFAFVFHVKETPSI